MGGMDESRTVVRNRFNSKVDLLFFNDARRAGKETTTISLRLEFFAVSLAIEGKFYHRESYRRINIQPSRWFREATKRKRSYYRKFLAVLQFPPSFSSSLPPSCLDAPQTEGYGCLSNCVSWMKVSRGAIAPGESLADARIISRFRRKQRDWCSPFILWLAYTERLSLISGATDTLSKIERIQWQEFSKQNEK